MPGIKKGAPPRDALNFRRFCARALSETRKYGAEKRFPRCGVIPPRKRCVRMIETGNLPSEKFVPDQIVRASPV